MNTQLQLNNARLVRLPSVKKAAQVAWKERLPIEIRGQGEVPDSGWFYQNEWWHEILNSDSTIPEEGKRRIAKFREAGLVSGIMIAHEAPKVLSKPIEIPQVGTDVLPEKKERSESFIRAILRFYAGLFGLWIVLGLTIDPALIIVTPDNVWISVMKWYD